MANIADNLFYTPHDQMLFWVAGYTADSNTDSVEEIIKSLTKNAQAFADFVGADLSQVKTFYNTQPPKYQYMRIFYMKTDFPHPSAFVLGDYEHCGQTCHHTMNSVLTT